MIFIHGGIYKFCEVGGESGYLNKIMPVRSWRIAELHLAIFIAIKQPVANRWAMYDTGAASLSLCLQATALGLVVHQLGGFDVEKAREVFHLPNECKPMAMMAVGYQADVDVLDDDFKETELGARSRAALNEQFYAGQWGRGVE